MLLKKIVVYLGFTIMATISVAYGQTQEYDNGAVRIHRFSGPPYDQVNSYWVEGPSGVFIVDAQRYKHQARYLADEIRRGTSKPVVAILITHHHPDHTGGLSTLRSVFGDQVPIMTSRFTRDDIRTDQTGLLASRRKMFGQDFPDPSEFPIPDHVVEDGDQLRLGGVTVVARVFLNADTPASVVWELPEQRVVFTGDVAIDRKTPSLRNGRSSAYLSDLDTLAHSTDGFSIGYPGHGNPAPPVDLIDQTRRYIVEVRKEVEESIRPDGSLPQERVAAIKATVLGKFDFVFDTPLFAAEQEGNILAVAKEMGARPIPALPAQRSPRELVRAFIDTVRSGKEPERADEFLADSVIAHQMNAENTETVVRTPSNYADHIREFLRLYGPFQFEITELLADGDRVYVRWRQVGRHLGEIDGFAPTGKPLVEIASAVYRVANGKIQEYWIQIDRQGFLTQLQQGAGALNGQKPK